MENFSNLNANTAAKTIRYNVWKSPKIYLIFKRLSSHLGFEIRFGKISWFSKAKWHFWPYSILYIHRLNINIKWYFFEWFSNIVHQASKHPNNENSTVNLKSKKVFCQYQDVSVCKRSSLFVLFLSSWSSQHN